MLKNPFLPFACLQVYLFYYIKGFYGGHRRYIRSRSNMQLAGVSDLEATDPKCRPQLYNTPDDEPSTEGVMPGQGLITPCGLLAWSQFNDSFVLHDKDIQQDIAVSSAGALPSCMNAALL